jgi:hypothetical protein
MKILGALQGNKRRAGNKPQPVWQLDRIRRLIQSVQRSSLWPKPSVDNSVPTLALLAGFRWKQLGGLFQQVGLVC